MTDLKFSEQDLGALFLMMLIATLLFGLSGLIGMLVMQWVTRQQYAKEDIAKHGISEIAASRLGGVVVIGLAMAFLLAHYISGYTFSDVGPMGIQIWGWSAFLLCFVLGLVEDFYNDLLSPQVRLILLASIFALVFLLWPDIIPSDLGYSFIDKPMSNPALGWFLSVIFCVGFINAVNMADGANGLVPGIVFVSSLIFHSVIGTFIWEVLSIVTGVFLLFNVTSGRLFLGDAGAYGLGSILVLGGFYAVDANWVSIEFAAVMMSYPCIELVGSILRRAKARRSIFKPDNFHLHNIIHTRIKRNLKSKVLANSAAGLMIACGSSGVAFMGHYMNWLSPLDSAWGWVFIAQVGVYIICYLSISSPSVSTFAATSPSQKG